LVKCFPSRLASLNTQGYEIAVKTVHNGSIFGRRISKIGYFRVKGVDRVESWVNIPKPLLFKGPHGKFLASWLILHEGSEPQRIRFEVRIAWL
jgi:hypothetical protein